MRGNASISRRISSTGRVGTPNAIHNDAAPPSIPRVPCLERFALCLAFDAHSGPRAVVILDDVDTALGREEPVAAGGAVDDRLERRDHLQTKIVKKRELLSIAGLWPASY